MPPTLSGFVINEFFTLRESEFVGSVRSRTSGPEAIFRGEFVKGLDGKIQQRAREKLKYLDAAASNSR